MVAPADHEAARWIGNKSERDARIAHYFEADARFRQAAATPIPLSHDRSKQLSDECEDSLQDYYEHLPRIPVSRCPICKEVLHRAMDPWGLDGFWWQDKHARHARELPPCPHFRVLTGAVNLEGLPAQGGRDEAFPGPEVPYVVPKVLRQPSMVAVISSFVLAIGYRAYPIVYFSEQPPSPGMLTQTWARRSYSFRNAKGRVVFTYDTSPWDFDLLPWIERRSIAWIAQGDGSLALVNAPPLACPYLAISGRKQPLAIKGDRLRTLTLPDGHIIDPFSE